MKVLDWRNDHFTPTVWRTIRHRFRMGHWPEWRSWLWDQDPDHICRKCGGHPW